MQAVLFFHLLSLGIWLGCILTEVVCERSVDTSTEQRVLIAKVHVAVDKFVELPALLVALITGLAMLPAAPLSPLFLLKIAAGLAAILLNVLCTRMVFKRHRAAQEGNFDEYVVIDHRQHVFGAGVLAAFLVALGIGGHYFAA